jgi:hypothetical protein
MTLTTRLSMKGLKRVDRRLKDCQILKLIFKIINESRSG